MGEDRSEKIIARIEASIKEEGFTEKVIFEVREEGYGDYPSFFELLVDLKLSGQGAPNSEAVFENMKMQINGLSKTIRDAAKDFTKLANKYRDLESLNNDLPREIEELKNRI